ncbi:hybrid sensor histidine kinase/response regulator transcription factor [Bacteroides sp. UBA939]|uniref:hybrid sensor histidine kinase/response regulator transcription factor n=1 Tax=Bacteroides sp. UBA939 TaxID=1946092 RepID=UPI0025C285C6|nr:two-component regulator propeller domain-containing protein [Bacteroides sp. UBA939]
MKHYLTFVILILLLTFHVHAQQTRFYGNGELSCNLITDICQDGDGFIWIGTAHGLNKFDGWDFSYYYNHEEDTTSLLSNYVLCLFKDSDESLWVGSNKGLQYYQPYENRFVNIQFPSGMHPTVENIIELHNGEIWITTSGWGVFTVDKEIMQARIIQEITDVSGTSSFGTIYQDRSNCIWLPLPSRKVLRIVDGTTKTYQVFETPGTISSFVEDAEGRLFVSFYSQVCQWEPVNRKFVSLKNETGNFMSPQMLHTQKGRIYISSYGQGIRYIDTDSLEIKKADHINVRHINPDNLKIGSMFEDRIGNVWFGCFQRGVLMLPNEKPSFSYWDFSFMGYDTDLTISSFYKDPDGRIWVGTDHGVLMELDEDGRVKRSWHDRDSGLVYMLEDSEGNFWIGRRYGGVSLFNKRTGQFKMMPEVQVKNIKWIVEGPDRKIYFSVFGDGLLVYDLSAKSWHTITGTTPMKTDARLKNVWINTMLRDSKGRIWLGHYSGVSCYDAVNECFLELDDDVVAVLEKAICYALLEDSQGNIWLGTSHGLYMYNPQADKLFHYATNEDSLESAICGLAEDKAGNIWCSTFKGIRKISPDNGKIITFLSGNGLLEKEYSRGIYFQDADGEIYFPSIQGITHFRPEDIRIPGLTEEPVLTGLYLNNQPVSPQDQSNGHRISKSVWTETTGLILSHTDNSFSLTFSTINFRAPGNISFEYKVTEADDKWTILPLGANRITYNNLSIGKHLLQVRVNENGVYTPVRNLELTILPPWYLSVPARIVYGMLILTIITLILYWQYKLMQKKRIEELNEEKMKFFINISHEIRSPMTMIISPLSMLLKKDYDEVTTKALHSMYRNTTRILTLINQMLDIRKIDKGQMRMTYSETDLVAFIQELIKVFDYQANERKIELSFEHRPESLPVWIDRNNFDKVLVNLIANALKFTPEGGNISLMLTTGEDPKTKGPLRQYAQISITDSGVGLDEKTIDRIFDRFYQDKTNALSGSGIGLNLCKTLVLLHHGKITAANRDDSQGSTFTIRIPLGNSHLSNDEIVARDSSPRIILHQNQATEHIVNQKKLAVKSKTRSKVLIIDDSEELLSYLKEELDILYKVITCNNAEDGLRTALEQNPDLIISDVVMPGMDGFTLLRKIKNNANISHIPVVLLTSKTDYDNRIKGWDKGADAILTKPFNTEELILICTNLITNRIRLKGKFSGIQDQEDKAKPVELKSFDEEFMGKVMSVINTNMENPGFNVETLANEVGLSRVQLYRRLKELSGMPSAEFIRNIRLRHAVELLKAKKINVSQVAYKVGYNNPALFSIAFKKYYGVSPSEFSEKEEGEDEKEEAKG